MPRYTTRRHAVAWIEDDDCWDDAQHMSIEVVTEDAEVEDTGLFDASGNRLYRMPDRHPLGFGIE